MDVTYFMSFIELIVVCLADNLLVKIIVKTLRDLSVYQRTTFSYIIYIHN